MEGNVSGYVCNHGSPNGERDTASPRLWTMLRTQASDEEADDVSSRRHLYCGTPVVTSWAVAGQQVVFLHMYLQTRVTLRAFPVAIPRGRSVSFPIRGTMVTYVTWDVLPPFNLDRNQTRVKEWGGEGGCEAFSGQRWGATIYGIPAPSCTHWTTWTCPSQTSCV